MDIYTRPQPVGGYIREHSLRAMWPEGGKIHDTASVCSFLLIVKDVVCVTDGLRV